MTLDPFEQIDQPSSKSIIKQASFNVQIDKDAIADRLKQTVESTLFGAAMSVTGSNAEAGESQPLPLEVLSSRTDPHLGLIELHTDRVIEQLELALKELIKIQANKFEEKGVDFFAKITPYDDGGKYTLSVRKSSLEQLKSGRMLEIDGIMDRSDIPANRDETQAIQKQIFGMDEETGQVIIDGQNLLKFLQAILQDKHLIIGDKGPIDRYIQALQLVAHYIPALQARVEDENVILELDMAKLKASISEFVMKDLNKVKGIDVIPPYEETPSTISIQVDYKALADQVMQVVADQLMSVNGIRVNNGLDDTTVSFSTDLRDRDNFVAQVQQQVGQVMELFGREIAEGLRGRTPPTIVSSVMKHFIKSSEEPSLQAGA